MPLHHQSFFNSVTETLRISHSPQVGADAPALSGVAKLGSSGRYAANAERDLHRFLRKSGLRVPLAKMDLDIVNVKADTLPS